GSTLLWDLGLLFRSQPLPRGRRETLESLWPLLADSDAAVAHRALWRMAALPGVEDFLAARLHVVKKVAVERLKALIDDLGSAEQKVRLDAEAALTQMREAAADALRLAESDADFEVRLRARRLLAKLQPRSPESAREHRAILALEARGTPAAVAVLRKL